MDNLTPAATAGNSNDLSFDTDPRLSFEARGLLLFALSQTALTPALLAKAGNLSRDKVYRLLSELIACGYCERKETRAGGAFRGVTYFFRPHPEIPYTVSPYPAYYNIFIYYIHLQDQDLIDQPDTVKPYTVKPETVTEPEPPQPEPQPVVQAEPQPDPLLGFTTPAKWFGGKKSRAVIARAAAAETGLGEAERTRLVNLLADLHGTRLLIDSGDEEELLRMQDMALRVYEMCKTAGLPGRAEEFTGLAIQQLRAEKGAAFVPYGRIFTQFVSKQLGTLTARLGKDNATTPSPTLSQATLHQLKKQRQEEIDLMGTSVIPETEEEMTVWLAQQK